MSHSQNLPQSKEALLNSYTTRLKGDVKLMMENFKEIIKLSKSESVTPLPEATQSDKDSFEIDIRATNIVRAGESLINLVTDIKQYLVLNDCPSENEDGAKNPELCRPTQAEYDQKLMILRDDMTADLHELEEEYYTSKYK